MCSLPCFWADAIVQAGKRVLRDKHVKQIEPVDAKVNFEFRVKSRSLCEKEGLNNVSSLNLH